MSSTISIFRFISGAGESLLRGLPEGANGIYYRTIGEDSNTGDSNVIVNAAVSRGSS